MTQHILTLSLHSRSAQYNLLMTTLRCIDNGLVYGDGVFHSITGEVYANLPACDAISKYISLMVDQQNKLYKYTYH